MNKIKIEDSDAAVRTEDFSKFEKKFKIILPENYKKLLLKYNGGVESEGDKILDTFYSLRHGDTTIEQAIEALQINEHILPDAYLPIGNSGTGNEIVFCLEGDKKGKILLFRHDTLETEIIADSLEELLGVNDIDEL